MGNSHGIVKGTYDKKGVSATVVPGTVRLGEAKASGNSITITWSKVSGASGYYVYRKVPSGDWKDSRWQRSKRCL